MTKESIPGIDKRLLLRKTFNDEQTTLSSEGDLIGTYEYSEGMLSYSNGSSQTNGFQLTKTLTGDFTFRVKYKLPSFVAGEYNYVLDFGTEILRVNIDRTYTSSGFDTKYLNGVALTTQIAEEGVMYEFVGTVSSSTISFLEFLQKNVSGSLDLIEIYEGTLTAEEASNLFNNLTYKELPDKVDAQVGSEIVTDGDFSSDTNWSPQSAWSITGGVAIFDDSTNSNLNSDVSVGLTEGVLYKAEFDISMTSGIAEFAIAASSGAKYNIQATYGSGHHSVYFRAALTNSTLAIRGYTDKSTGTWSIDNFSVKEVVEGTHIEKIMDVNSLQGALKNTKTDDTYDELVSNGDFALDSNSDGLADSWAGYLTVQFPDFTLTDDVQRVTTNQTIIDKGEYYRMSIIQAGVFAAGSKYSVRFRLRASKDVPMDIRMSDYTTRTVIAATTDWQWFEFEHTCTVAGTLMFNANTLYTQLGEWFELSFVSVKEIIPALVNTDVEVKKIGDYYSPSFEGGKLDVGNYDDLTGDITILNWINPRTYGYDSNGKILSNNILLFTLLTTDEQVAIVSDGSTVANSAVNSIDLNEFQCVAVTRTSAGVANIYVDSILSGSADQDSGTPTVGTTNIIIGNRNDSAKDFIGFIPRTIIYKGLLSKEQITQFWTSTKQRYMQ